MPNFDSWSDWSCNCIIGTRTRTRNCVRGDCTNVNSIYFTQNDQCTQEECPSCTSNTDCDNGANICHQGFCEVCDNFRTAQACQE